LDRDGIPAAVHLRMNTAGLKYVLLVPASKKRRIIAKAPAMIPKADTPRVLETDAMLMITDY